MTHAERDRTDRERWTPSEQQPCCRRKSVSLVWKEAANVVHDVAHEPTQGSSNADPEPTMSNAPPHQQDEYGQNREHVELLEHARQCNRVHELEMAKLRDHLERI
jgi:hypothetical protein